LLKFDYSSEKVDTQKSGLTSLPDELHLGCRLGGYVPGNEGGEDLIRHPILFAVCEERLFFKIEAVFAVEVA
jgi:hypothetical protein